VAELRTLPRNTTPITPFVGHPGWNLITAMADEAIGWMKQLNDLDPWLPFMIYYAPGATHAPHHPTLLLRRVLVPPLQQVVRPGRELGIRRNHPQLLLVRENLRAHRRVALVESRRVRASRRAGQSSTTRG
jgi:arylsulfatase A-like enzyme